MSPHCSDVWSALRSSVQSLSGAVFYAGDQISPMLRLPTQVKIQNQAVFSGTGQLHLFANFEMAGR